MAKKPRKIFIETSIQIERILGRIARKEQIRATLEGAEVSTSSYVWMEFRRTALQAMAYLLTIIRQMQQEGETDILFSELMKRVATGTAIGYSRRVLQVASPLCGDNWRMVTFWKPFLVHLSARQP
ncbi:TPA: hypothetical protein EYP66_18785 [Candidatus Poribacteria bacterium]|nr:hypothetical protein [Candidatus Poribacteria bacterium]